MARKIIRRQLAIKGQEKPESASDRAARQAIKYIENHPQFRFILQSMQEGTTNADLAHYCCSRGLFDVNEKTAIAYFQYFRKHKPEAVRPVAPQAVNADSLMGYDHLLSGLNTVSAEDELIKLIKVQKARIAINFAGERTINLLMSSTNKEVIALKDMLMDLAKLRGLGTNVNVSFGMYDENVRADLQELKHEEQQRSVLTSVVGELVKTTNALG